MHRFRQYLLPGIIFQSVLIGGAYATGREIVEYGAQYGAMGVWSIVALGAGFSLMAFLAYEFARVHQVYDYRNFVRRLIGPLWPLFDVLFILSVIITIAVVNAASGRVVEEVLGWPYWVGVALLIVLVSALMAGGRRLIERFKTFGTAILYGGYLLFTGLVLAARWDHVEAVFASGDVTYSGPLTLGPVVFAGILYVAYNLATLPSTFFVLDAHTRRRHTLGAGLVSGVLATVPFVLTYLAVMGFYPDAAVLDAPVPWLVMLGEVGGPALLNLFAVVILWTLVETSTGMIHAVITRIDANLVEVGRKPLRPLHLGLLTVGVLLTAALLSRLGLIALVAKGYAALAYGFILLFIVPLLTIGVAHILKAWRKP